MSDFHAGATNSLLTELTEDYSPRTGAISEAASTFADALNQTLANFPKGSRFDLILLGDMLDFSLARPDVSSNVLACFLDKLDFVKKADRAVYVPGNHDHALWTAERFGALAGHGTDPGSAEFWSHITPMAGSEAYLGHSTIMGAVLAQAGFGGQALTAYPNYVMGNSSLSGTEKMIAFHHGHFIEDAYRAMTNLLATLSGEPTPPLTVEILEGQNGAWIDFAWSTLGDLGTIGTDGALAQRFLETGGAAHAFQSYLARLMAQAVKSRLPMPSFDLMDKAIDYGAAGLVDYTVGAFSQLERFSYQEVLSRASIAGLKGYIGGPLRQQMIGDFGKEALPRDLSFVFGHTHKPFTDQIVVDEFKRPVTVYNSGGWVMDTALMHTVEGASIVVIDEDLHTAALQLYRMTGASVTPPEVQSADPIPDADNLMFTTLDKARAGASRAWETFTRSVDRTLAQRQDMYLANGRTAELKLQKQGRLP